VSTLRAATLASPSIPGLDAVQADGLAPSAAVSEQATAADGAAAQVDPTGTLVKVQAFSAALSDCRTALDRIAAKLPNPPVTEADRQAHANDQAMERRDHELAAGFCGDATPAQGPGMAPTGGPSVGVAPAVLVVGGLAVGAVGVAWAIAADQYAVNLREQTALAERELDARVEASREGRPLQNATLPPPPSPASDAKGTGLWLFGGLAVVAGALAIPVLLKR
jgi:hypothetical protein